MMAVALWWGYDSSLALELWQLFCGGDTMVVCNQIMAVVCGGDTTVEWILNDAICFVVGTRQ
jgi:hypothetical protein